MKTNQNTLLQFTHYGMGSGDEALGLHLAENYLKLISEDLELPKFITFYNSGVKLIAEGSPCIPILKTLEKRGVKLVACKTCINHYNLANKIQVGNAGKMEDIVTLQKIAEKVLNL